MGDAECKTSSNRDKAKDPTCYLCGVRGTIGHILSGCPVSLSQGRHRWHHNSVLSRSHWQTEKNKKARNDPIPINIFQAGRCWLSRGNFCWPQGALPAVNPVKARGQRPGCGSICDPSWHFEVKVLVHCWPGNGFQMV